MSHRVMPPGGGAARGRVLHPLQVGARNEREAYRCALHGFTHLNIFLLPEGRKCSGMETHF